MRTGGSEEAQKAMATQRIGVLMAHLVGVFWLICIEQAFWIICIVCVFVAYLTHYMWVLHITSCTASLISILMGH